MSRKMLMIKLICKKNGFERAEYLKKKQIFKSIGEHCYFHPCNIPSEPKLVSLGDNVVISSGVRIITHDMSYTLLNNHTEKKYGNNNPFFTGEISIGNNVMIGADAMLMPNITIGDNVVIAAGSIVTKDIPSNSVVGGVPARFLESFDEFAEKRRIIGDKKDGTI